MKLRVVFFVAALLITPQVVSAGPKVLSDEELEEITARGVDLGFNFNAETGDLGFNFNTGSTVGNGSVTSSPISTPSNLTLTGNTNLSNSTFIVENMILNLNICAMCNATVINQLGLGFGITINPQQ